MRKNISIQLCLIVLVSVRAHNSFCFEGGFRFEVGKETGKEPYTLIEEIKKPSTGKEAEEFKRRKQATDERAQEVVGTIVSVQEQLKNELLSPVERQDLVDQLIQARKTQEIAARVEEVYRLPEVQALLPRLYEQPLPGEANDVLFKDVLYPVFTSALKSENIKFLEVINSQLINFENAGTMKSIVDAERNPDAKRAAISTNRAALQHMREAIEQKQAELQTKKINQQEQYTKLLESIKQKLNNNIMSLDGLQLQLDAQQIGFFDRLALTIKNLFNKYFGRPGDAPTVNINEQQKIIDQVTAVAQPLGQLMDDVGSVLSDVNKLKEGNIDQMSLGDLKTLQSNLKEQQKKLAEFEQKITARDAQLLQEAYNDILKTANQTFAEMERYSGEFNTLFEKQLAAYEKELKGSLFKPDQMYEALGLLSENVDTITQEQLDQAYTLQRQTTGGKGDYVWQAGRNASTILTEPYARATYDAFLHDYKLLQEKGIDPSRPLSQEAREILKNQGKLEPIAIDKNRYDMLKNFRGSLFTYIPTIATPAQQFGNLIASIGAARGLITERLNMIEDALEKGSQEATNQLEQIPGG